MSYYLFLDDFRMPKNVTWVRMPTNVHWEIVRSYQQFVNYITDNGIPKFIAFDHDLADEHYGTDDKGQYVEKTGYDCAKWLIEYCLTNNVQIPQFVVHSMNPVGKNRIEMLLLR